MSDVRSSLYNNKKIIPKINVLKKKAGMRTKNTSTSKVDDVEKCSSLNEHLFVGSLYDNNKKKS